MMMIKMIYRHFLINKIESSVSVQQITDCSQMREELKAKQMPNRLRRLLAGH